MKEKTERERKKVRKNRLRFRKRDITGHVG